MEASPILSSRTKITRAQHSEFTAYIRERTKARRQANQARDEEKREEEMRKMREQHAARTLSEPVARQAIPQAPSDASKSADGRVEEEGEDMWEQSIDGVVSYGGVGEWKRLRLFRWKKIEY